MVYCFCAERNAELLFPQQKKMFRDNSRYISPQMLYVYTKSGCRD